jgi:hypothetical protein
VVALADADTERVRPGSTEHLYGEFTTESVTAMLEALSLPGAAEPLPFLDFGSGVGKAVLAAALLRPDAFEILRGIELLPALDEVAQGALRRYEALPGELPPVELVCGDMLWVPEEWLEVKTVVYIFATMYSGETMLLLEARLNELPPGSVVALVSKALDNPGFREMGIVDMVQSYSGDTLPTRLYERV